MANEPMPWNLTVAQLGEFLAACQPNAIVGTTVTREMVERLDALTSTAPDATLYLGLAIASEPGLPTVTLRLQVDPPMPTAP
jgi:hypothetical protein